jgi:outer membrane protein insertion porin family
MPNKRTVILIFLFLTLPLCAQQSERYELNSINFVGNNSFSSSALKEIIFSQTTPWWFWKFLHSFTPLGKEPVYFDSSNIPLDLFVLKDYYKANGFFQAQFNYKYKVDTSDKTVDLTYIINENNACNFGKLNVFGLESISRYLYNNIYSKIELDSNTRFAQSVVQNNSAEVINNLLNNGYMLAKYDSTIIYQDTVHYRANVDAYFTTGKRYTIDTVLIKKSGEGASLVENSLLRDITGLKVGQVYNLEEIRRSQVRLYRTGLFNSVLLSAAQKDTTDSKVPLRLDGNIGLMNELSPEVIMNTQQNKFNLGLGYSYIRKNFLGDARKLTLSTSFAIQNISHIDYRHLIKNFSFRNKTLNGYVDARLTIDQPYLFEKPIFGTWETYATINKQPINGYNSTVYGSKITFEFELPTYTFINHLSASYNIEQSNELYIVYNDSTSKKYISDISADAVSTTADNILFPTKGYNLSLHIEEANAIPYIINKIANWNYTGSLFYKAIINGSMYKQVDRKGNSIAAFKMKVGYLQTFYGSFSGVPINRTFYTGGTNSIRGWLSNQLVPAGSREIRQVAGITKYVSNFVGGTFLLEGSSEFRRKFWDKVGYAIFFDYGNTFNGYKQFRWDDIAVATGFGLRYYTDIAPFRVDFGFKFYNPSNKKFMWERPVFKDMVIHFGIGEAF